MTETVQYPSFDAPAEPLLAAVPPAGDEPAGLQRLHDVPVELAVEIGRTKMTIGQALSLGPGAFVTLNRLAGEPVDLLVNGKAIARGEVVVIDEEFGLRITEIIGAAPALAAVPDGGPSPVAS
jgi:flagellar motor switch protein FliN/FliY